VAWRQGWKYVGMSFDVNRYKPKSRYNSLHISKTLIAVAQKLQQVGLVVIHKGYYDHATGKGYVSRLQPSATLLKRFMHASWPDEAIDYHWQRELVELRDYGSLDKGSTERRRAGKQILIDYEDTSETNRMRQLLAAYNALLKNQHIDCCHLSTPVIHRKDNTALRIDQHDRCIRRVFNNGRFDKGGRFYGGFWQQIPSQDRQHIRINGQRTVEIDYKALHIVLLYARMGIDYWSYSAGIDPYVVQVDGLASDEARQLGKRLLLMAINAHSEQSAYKALRKSVQDDTRFGFPISLTDRLLGNVMEQLQERHTPIAVHLCSGIGIDLQYLDSKLTEALIEHFTGRNIPILSIHDSYIVPHDCAAELRDEMTRVLLFHLPQRTNHQMDWHNVAANTVQFKQIGYDDELLGDIDHAPHADNANVLERHKAVISEIDAHAVQGYWNRLERFKRYNLQTLSLRNNKLNQ
jgi:hypothetical protein